MNKEIIPVCFRAYRDNGEIIAIFPTMPESYNAYMCRTYEHFGQHGAADPLHMVEITTPAQEEQYTDLHRELISIGYDNLRIVQKVNTSHYLRIRREEIARTTRTRGTK